MGSEQGRLHVVVNFRVHWLPKGCASQGLPMTPLVKTYCCTSAATDIDVLLRQIYGGTETRSAAHRATFQTNYTR